MRISDTTHHQQAEKVREAIKIRFYVKVHPHCKAKLHPRVSISPWVGGREDLKMHLSPPHNFLPFATAQ